LATSSRPDEGQVESRHVPAWISQVHFDLSVAAPNTKDCAFSGDRVDPLPQVTGLGATK